MFKSLLLATTLATSSINPLSESYPKSLSEPAYQVDNYGSGLKYWIILSPKCLVEHVYTPEGALATEITLLEPEDTEPSDVVALVMRLEGLEGENQYLAFGGISEDKVYIFTVTPTDHFIRWERNPETNHIKKVVIVYQKPALKS